MTSGPPSAPVSAPVSTSPFSDHPSSAPAPSFTTPNSASPVEMKAARSSAPIYVALGVVLLMSAVALGFALSTTPDADERSDVPAATEAPAPSTASVGAPSTAAQLKPGRTVSIQSTPKGATVTEDGAVVCEPTPCDAKWQDDGEGDHVVKIALEGHQPRIVRISAATEQVTADLEPMPPPQKPRTIPWTSPRPQPPRPTAPAPAKTSVPGYKDSPY